MKTRKEQQTGTFSPKEYEKARVLHYKDDCRRQHKIASALSKTNSYLAKKYRDTIALRARINTDTRFPVQQYDENQTS